MQTAVAAKRWTEEDKETFSAVFGVLTNTQHMDLMNILAPAINSGEITVEVTGPDGNAVSLGKLPFAKQAGYGPTTGRSGVTAWVPPAYGQYTVKETGWIRDISGNRYEGGGTYRFLEKVKGAWQRTRLAGVVDCMWAS